MITPQALVQLIAAAPPPNIDPKDYTTDLPHVAATHSQTQQILQIVLAIAAALAVLMIVIAGLRFVLGQGNPQEVSKARSTIIYALVGLLLALTAEAIVTLVIGKL